MRRRLEHSGHIGCHAGGGSSGDRRFGADSSAGSRLSAGTSTTGYSGASSTGTCNTGHLSLDTSIGLRALRDERHGAPSAARRDAPDGAHGDHREAACCCAHGGVHESIFAEIF